MKKLVPQSLKNIYHLFQAVLANVWYGFPSRKLKVIGVTGTNGKTTTVQMIAKILEEAGHPVKPDGHGASKIAVASTINFKIGEKEWVNDTKFTTFSSFRLQDFLRKAAGAGCEYAIVEVTSHALDQNRVWGVDFDIAVVTNVTREHLDYHKTIEEYAKAKMRLFKMVSKNSDGVAVVNLGMEGADEFLKYPVDEKYGYAVKFPISNFQYPIKSQIPNQKINKIIAEEIELGTNYSKFKVATPPLLPRAKAYQNSKFFLNLPGLFNVENALAATCVGLSQGIPLEKISQALAKVKGIPGRMERIENDRGLEIIVDYAVTPDSLEKLYGLIGEIRSHPSHPSVPSGHLPSGRGGSERKIIAVFGACGERDRGKRPIMGEIVARHADYCIVANEDPYNENPQKIIDEVFAGVVGINFDKINSANQGSTFPLADESANSSRSNLRVEGVNCWRILDRREAIKKALQIAKPGDIVVVTGKGAEETMAVGKKRIPWNDPRVIREVLRELG